MDVRSCNFLPGFVLVFSAVSLGAQSTLPPVAAVAQPRVEIVSPGSPQLPEVLAVPAQTSARIEIEMSGASRREPAGPDPGVVAWVRTASAKFGLSDSVGMPWHVVVAFERFDEDGDRVDAGTLDETWFAPNRYRRTYHSDKLNQTDIATPDGLYREGDQRWPNKFELEVRSQVLEPFEVDSDALGTSLAEASRDFGKYTLTCEDINGRNAAVVRTYCFAPGTDALRYKRGWAWEQIAYNGLVRFQGKFLATDVDVRDGGKPYLHMTVTKLEAVAPADASPVPGTTAVKLDSDLVTGVQMHAIKTVPPQWSAPRDEHFTVVVDIVVGKDGRVETAHAVSGPEKYYASAEKTAKQWTFEPYRVLGAPKRVQMRIQLSQN